MLAHVPVWVFAVLALLIVVGLRHRRARALSPRVTAVIAAALTAYSAWGVGSAFAWDDLELGAWLAGLAAAFALGASWLAPRGMRRDALTDRVHVPGSWLPMVAMLGIFALKFALGMAAGMATPVMPGSTAAVAIAGSLGALGGMFAGRAWAVLRVARGAVGGPGAIVGSA